jgi:hypothetical protein
LETKNNYRCFSCGHTTITPTEMNSQCKCGLQFDFMLEEPPERIGDYVVSRSLARGFYGVTYVVKKGRFGIERALKVSPKFFYKGRSVTFEDEVNNHFRASDGAEYIVRITDDPFEEVIDFGGHTIDCYCTEMEYVPGFVLSDIYSKKTELTPEMAVQISCDLISILRELKRRELNHNDLHAGNIIVEVLQKSSHRADAVARGIKARAIDLGSVDSQRREGGKFKSDVQWIAQHLRAFSKILADDNPEKSDLRARVGFVLGQQALELSTPQAKQADQSLEDLIQLVRTSYQNAKKRYFRGWKVPLQLGGFDAHRNAQTLESWYVPQLMVDPGERWLKEINTGGPVVMTGMRGCGKTMLLRSLELHARIIIAQSRSKEIKEQKTALISDGYLGILASARHLADSLGEPNQLQEDTEAVSNFFARLFLVYGRRICDALNHLEEAFPGTVADDAANRIAATLFGQIGRENPIPITGTLDELQTVLVLDAELWSTDASTIELVAEPWTAFVLLAQSVQSVLLDLEVPQVVFLLDDVSTRYLQPRQIELVVSTLLVQDPSCAFKITSEMQTFFLSIKSPALINQASDERDYSSFDLGSKVLEQLKIRSQSGQFLERILTLRMKAIGGDLADMTPRELLGDEPLSEIANKICKLSASLTSSGTVYYGFSALKGVCIGDLGTSIALFQEIVNRAKTNELPVPKATQHEVFQEFCSNQLFQLNNRDGKQKTSFSLKKVALEFADASHAEMLDSYRNEKDRLRQITSMNVTLDEGNAEQIQRLLELVDAGVFALHPRKLSSRTKNRDSDPVLQFQLSFRKILGISKLIGLSDRDRFELNGQQFLEWMDGAKGALNLRAHTRRYPKGENPNDVVDEVPLMGDVGIDDVLVQGVLPLVTRPSSKEPKKPTFSVPSVRERNLTEIGEVDNLIVSIGFEDRCLPSAKRIAAATRPKHIVAIEYPIPGKAKETADMAAELGATYQIIKSEDVLEGNEIILSGKTIIDTSGLTKPVIYKLVKSDFATNGQTVAAITEPLEFSPTEADLKAAIGDGKEFHGDAGVEKLANILSGDTLPYSLLLVEELRSDPSRNRKLCAFSSAKHGRLMHLVDELSYDEIDVLVQSGASYRSAVALKAASIATGGGELGSTIAYSADDPSEILKAIFQNHYSAYLVQNSNFEIALTGGKLETIMCGVAGACLPLNKVLYVKPADFETANFSSGLGETKLFEILRSQL